MQQQGGEISNKISDMDWSSGGGYHMRGGVCRFGSSSSQTSQNSGDICRICHCESETQNPLLTPCYCSGSLKYVHQSCLQQWLTASETTSCELCKFPFIMHTKIKPFNEWRALQMSGIERRRLVCSVLFHCAAATCVIWSLCVLIERATEEVKRGLISWPFWTKLVVVTVGLTGGVVFMYIQCKAYLSLCTRWRARNRILLIQNAPEKVAPPPQEPTSLRDSPPLVFNRTNLSLGSATPGCLSNTSGMGTQVSTMALNRSVYSAASHGQIVANIESNSQTTGGTGGSSRQSRDWTSVYVEDMGFYPEEDASATSSKACNLNMFKGHHQSVVGGATAATPIFLENQDILSDTPPEIVPRRLFEDPQRDEQFPTRSKFSRHRHSLMVDTTGPVTVTGHSSSGNQSDNFRRYSDTRLIMEPHHEHQPQIFNVATGYAGDHSGSQRRQRAVMDGVVGGADDIEGNPQITDILFESVEHGSSFDPLELNIQELLELDIRTNVRGGGMASNLVAVSPGGGGGGGDTGDFRSSQLSVNSDPQKYFKGDSQRTEGATRSEQKYLLTPQSLPNLSASSSENLLVTQQQQQPPQSGRL